ncbi:beta strand repeat-containing protein, partial [Endozoicomonas arenosclerae]|uniref:beta strand repeat-containing protein n=1 Tax=Endozoicomonas arenosclerae TaxID=1633495 RepID=UPI000A49BAE5
DNGTSTINVASMTFTGSESYTGSQTDDATDIVTDNTGGAWTVTGTQTLESGSRSLSGVDRVNTSGNITDNSPTDWSVDGANLISSSGRGLTIGSTTQLTTQGNVTDATNKGWAVRGDNLAFSTDNALTVAGTDRITTTGAITNEMSSGQEVQLNATDITVGGIAFAGSKAYTGRAENDDTVVDNNKNNWTLTGANEANDNNYYLSRIGGLSSEGGIVTSSMASQDVAVNSDTDGEFLQAGGIKFRNVDEYVGASAYDTLTDNRANSTWFIRASRTVNNGSFTFSNIDEVTTSGSVTNQFAGQDVDIEEGVSGYKVANIHFDASTVYIGSGTDRLVDSTTVADSDEMNLAAAGQILYKNYDFSQINRVSSTAKVDDNANSGNWTVEGNTIAKGGSITFTGVSQIKTTQGIANGLTVGQTVTLDDDNGTSTINVASMTFTGSESYTGSQTDDATDIVTDNTGGAWTVTGTQTLESGSRSLSGVDRVNTSGNITDNSTTDWSVDGANLISSSGRGLTIGSTTQL